MSAPRNEFMHLFINSGFLKEFGQAMHGVLSDNGAPPEVATRPLAPFPHPFPRQIRIGVSELLATFARGDARVKKAICDSSKSDLLKVKTGVVLVVLGQQAIC